MSFSKLMADRMIIDIHGLILSIRYAIDLLNSKHQTSGEEIIKEVKKDLSIIEKDSTIADSLDSYYDFSFDQQYQSLNQIVENIENGNFSKANHLLDILSNHAEGKLDEHFAERIR